MLLTLLIGYIAPAFAQSSTEGKEFWVGLTMAIRPPGDGDGEASPYLAISTKDTTRVTFSSPAFPGETFTETIGAFQWKKIEIPKKWWYPSGVGKPSKVKEHADEVNNYGVFVKADRNISVFAILRAGAGMDASNILPTTALQTEYILQDYIPHAKDGGLDKDAPYTTMATILATEDNTEITVKPKGTLLKASTPQLVNNKITLNKGQTYYLMAENSGTDLNCLSGTEITSDKKIAVFQGVPCTFVPHDVGNRDCLYEQAMPIDYWGTEFVATRSYAKGANIIRITASNDNQKTTITVNGTNVASINRGDTYEIELAANTPEKMNNSNKKTLDSDLRIVGEYVHIKTSCPAAVYSYDCGKGYTDKDDMELDPDGDQQGDPSSVWIAPMEQSIDQITFGACGTKSDGGNLTEHHYLDIVVETASVNQTVLYSYLNSDSMDITSSFKPVAGTKYSYARVYLAKADDTKNAVFTVTNPNKLVAHVYGNGKSESYSYSVGSSAVVQGVNVNNVTFTDGFRSEKKFCMGTDLVFDATIGTGNVITRVNWDFGDGITDTQGSPITTHTYTNPGWYDVTAELFGHQVCANESELPLGSVNFTFRVWQPKTKMGTVQPPICIEADSTLDGRKLTAAELQDLLLHGMNDTVIPDECYEDTIVNYVTYGIKTKDKKYGKDTIGYDQIVLNGTTYTLANLPANDTVEWIETNQYGCDSLFKYHVIIRTCLDIDITNPDPATQYTCLGEPLPIHYEINNGDIDGNAVFTIDELPKISKEITIPQTPSEGWINLPVEDIQKPGLYHGHIAVKDRWCPNDFNFPINILVRYPSDVFKFKFFNVLAVRQDAGYNFIHYQWYINNQPVGGDVSVLYLGEDVVLQETDEVYVRLTDQNGMVLESCPQQISYENKPIKPNKAPIQKIIKNQRMYILRDEQMYDMFGREVK